MSVTLSQLGPFLTSAALSSTGSWDSRKLCEEPEAAAGRVRLDWLLLKLWLLEVKIPSLSVEHLLLASA